MKRQRHGDGGTKAEDHATSKARKKNKKVVDKVEEEAENGVESAPAVAAAVVEESLGWEEWPLLTREVVDEEMSWGYFSLPIWGVEFMAEAYGSLFSDVVWDDDIWNLKSIREIPANI